MAEMTVKGISMSQTVLGDSTALERITDGLRTAKFVIITKTVLGVKTNVRLVPMESLMTESS